MKKLLMLIFAIFLGGCRSLPRDMQWESSRDVYILRDKLQVGDVIIKSREPEPMSWFGHSAVVIAPGTIGDYPKLRVGYQEIGMYTWLMEPRSVVVLRYDGFSDKFREKFLVNAANSTDKSYWINFDKEDGENTYCSKYVWHLYLKTSKEMGIEIDIDSDGGVLVTPYDILNSGHFRQIKITEKK